ncbi:MAG: hypothetical protein NTX09_04900 [Verrucomicrobia bacterium]|nr:hypothetical protein [Verrucomicrobiota bacterium]
MSYSFHYSGRCCERRLPRPTRFHSSPTTSARATAANIALATKIAMRVG